MDDQFVVKARLHLAKIKNEILHKDGNGEEITHNLRSALVPITQIQEDPEFKNVRQKIDPEKYTILRDSIQQDGLKVPIIVRASDDELDTQTKFWARAGFRRLKAVRELGWTSIPAMIIPCDTPDISDYWINLSENCHKESVSPYEIACQARYITSKHGSSIAEIAKRTSLSPGTIADYIRYLQYLPDDILTAWKESHPLLTRMALNRLSSMAPWSASATWRKMLNKMPLDPSLAAFSKRPLRKIRTAPFELMQSLHHALGVEKSITPEARKLALRCLEICMGSKPVIPGIWPSPRKLYIVGPKFEPEELDLPEAGDGVSPPTEKGTPALVMTDDDESSYSLSLKKPKKQERKR